MKKSLSFIMALMLVLTFIFTLNIKNIKVNAATSDQEIIQEELNNITVPATAIIDFPVVSHSANGATITWTSDNENVLSVPSNGGWVTVNRPTDSDATVVLTVKLELNGEEGTKEFTVNVPKGVTATNEYKIEYVLYGGENAPSNPTTYKVGQTPAILAPTKGTLAFLGWYDNPEFKGNVITNLPKGTSGDVKLYAKWAAPEVIDIEISGNYKTEYNALETFDRTGIVVKAIYNDGTNKDVTNEVAYDKKILHGDDTSVKVTYESFTKDIAITVSKLFFDLSEVVFESASKEYNGASQTLAYTGTLPTGLTAQVEGSATNVSDTEIKLVFTVDSEYQRDYETPSAIVKTLTITKAPLVVTADSKSIVHGASIPELTISYSGFKGSDDSSVLSVLPTVSTTATSSSAPGTYPIVITKDATAANYNITFKDGTLSINAGHYTISSSNATVTYNGKNQTFTAVVKDASNNIITVELNYTLDGNTFTGKTNVGSYQVLVSFNDTTYGVGSETITFVIEPKELNPDMFAELPEVSYTGSAHQPSVNGTFDGTALVQDTDYELSYENNTDKGTANVIVKGIGNYTGEVTLTFTIGASDLERVTEAKAYLQANVTNIESGSTLPTTHANGSVIFYASTSTALSVNANGVVTTVLTDTEQTVTLYAIITKDNAAEYQAFTVTLPAKAETPEGLTTVTNGNVTVSGLAPEHNVQSVEVQQVTQDGFILAYDITLKDASNNTVSLGGHTVTVRINGTFEVGKTYQVYHIDGTNEELVQEVVPTSAEYIEFTTTHFSVYGIKEKAVEPVIEELTIAEFLAKETSDTNYYKLTGVISNIANTTYGNFDLVDETGSVYVYGLTATQVVSNDKSFASLGLTEGDTVTIIGIRAVFNSTAQVGGPAYYVSSVKPERTVTLEEIDATLGSATLDKTSVNSGETVTLTVTPADGYVVKSVKANDVAVSAKETNVYEITITSNTTIVVEFMSQEEVDKFEAVVEDNSKIIIAAVRSSGNYFIMSSDLGSKDTKRYQAVDSGVTEAISISAKAENQVWTVEVDIPNKCYYLKASNGQYMTWTSGNSGNLSDERYALQIIKNDDGTFTITSISSLSDSEAEDRVLALNADVKNNYAAFYKSTGNGIKNFQFVTYVEISDSDKIDYVYNNLVLDSEVYSGVVSLPNTSSYDSTVEWVATPSENLVNGILINNASTDVTVSLVATIKIGELSKSKNFDVVVKGQTVNLDSLVTTDPYEWVKETGTVSTDEDNKTYITLDCGDFILTMHQNTNTSNKVVNIYDQLRMYANHKITITMKDGSLIKNVKFTITQGGNTLTFTNTDCTSIYNSTDKVIEISSLNGVDTIEFTTTAQIRITIIEVTYISDANA